MDETLAMLPVLAASASGLVVPNLLLDLGSRPSFARFSGGAIGGLAYLLAVLLLEPLTAMVISGVATIVLTVLKLRGDRHLRGVTTAGRGARNAEVTFLAMATVSLTVGWGLLRSPSVAFLPIAFIAWGDNLAGLVRAETVPRLAPAIVMLLACVALAVVILDSAAGAIAALLATAFESGRLPVTRSVDDNILIGGSSLLLLAVTS